MNTAQATVERCSVSGQTSKEEFFNALTHFLGFILSIAGLPILIVFATFTKNPYQIVAASLFGTSLVLLYLASTLYHLSKKPKIKWRLKIFDHSCIYVLIAGSYTPFLFGPLKGTLGWTLFGILWGLTAIGIGFKLFFVGRFRLISTFIYLAMGWMIVFAMKPLYNQMPEGALTWLIIGGAFYTVGAILYMIRRLPYYHAIWHLFVLGGSASHYICVLGYIIPASQIA